MTPAYQDVSLAIQRTIHPLDDIEDTAEAIKSKVDELRENVQTALDVEGLALMEAARVPAEAAARERSDSNSKSASGGGKRKLSERARSERKLAWMLCAPAVVAMLLVTAYPIVYAFVLSLQRVDLRFPDEGGWVGLNNYIDVLTSSLWWQDVANTVGLSVISVSIEFALGMGIALLMHRAIFGRGVVRTSVLIPYGIVTVVAAFSWQFAFPPDTGFVNSLPFVADDMDWFGSRFSAFFVIILAEVWKTTPFIALLLLAGLTTIDDGLYEAARVDGANAWQRFWRITLPLMKPAILVALLFRTLDAFRVFDSIFVMTRGSVDTESVSILGYNQLISRLNLGLGSAVSVLIFLMVLGIAALFVKGFGTAVPGREEDR